MAHTRSRPASRNHFKQLDDGLDFISRRDRTDLRGACFVARDTDAERCAATGRLGARTHVRGNIVEVERAATIDGDRNFRR